MTPSSHTVAPPASLAMPPAIRRRLRRLRESLRQLERDLGPLFSTAFALSLSGELASSFDSTPQDHVVADLIVALRTTAAAIADLDHPIPYDEGISTVPADEPI